MSAFEFVQLRSGYIVPLAALRLALDLEARGCSLLVEGADILVGPREQITDEDRDGIRRWRNHIMAILACQMETIQ